MNDSTTATRPNWLFWLIGLVSLLWNSFGAYDYVMSQRRDMDYLASVTGSEGLAKQMVVTMDAMPIWAHTLWALGIWSSVLGSVLLLMRSRHAAPVFLVSLITAGLSFAYQATLTMPAELDTPAAKILPLAILGSIVLQWWWARRQADKGR